MRNYLILFLIPVLFLLHGSLLHKELFDNQLITKEIKIFTGPSISDTVPPIPDVLADINDTIKLESDTLKSSLFDQFYNDSILNVTLEMDMEELDEKRISDEYGKGIFTYQDTLGLEIAYEIKVRGRGKTRRKLCDFPPLRLKFRKKDLKKNGLEEYTNYKLVTHCFPGEESDHNVMKEFLAYKLLNLITEKSFRVQLLEITYIDNAGTLPLEKHYGFIIENNEEVARRLESKEEEELFNCPLEQIDTTTYLQMAVYQFLIGNTDWYVKVLHNIKLMRSKTSQLNFSIPYDFDYSGIVNAHYAIPNPNIKQDSLTHRVFMCMLQEEEKLRVILENYKSYKDTLLQYCEQFPYLEKDHKKEVHQFIKSFFKILNSKRLRKKYFFKKRAKIY